LRSLHIKHYPTAYDLVATFVYRPSIEAPEAMALRFGGSKRFEAVRLSAFARLDERLGARVELATVAETVVTWVREEWPRAAARLADRPDLCGKIERLAKARATRLLH